PARFQNGHLLPGHGDAGAAGRSDRAVDRRRAGRRDDQLVDWAYALKRHNDTLADDIPSPRDVITPIRGTELRAAAHRRAPVS
ncbi:MAG: hypothetical protein ACR2OH_05085, partial [Microthrixaceae bacterium]